jgi:beta-galactosidase/beta-glucuronidase
VAERRGRLERDFASMVGVGVNTVFGWDPAQFDGLTLDVAAAHGLGVALPFDFDFGLDYASEEVQASVRSEVLAWVERYRAHPALRMWAIGNETFHKLVPPAWCAQPPADEQASRASAFARFYVDLIDRVNALDPNHPVIYRAAEDSYVSWLREALADGRWRPWFVYGLNVYSPRLKEVLENWDQHGLDAAVLVSEFGPSPEERPAGFQQYWSWIRSHPDSVIGGAVYVWFTEGPEAVDRVYGLVDGQGQAVDGGLATIGELYLGETPAGQ